MEKSNYFKKNMLLIFIILVSFIVYCYGVYKNTSDIYLHDGINFIENALRMGVADFKYYGYGHGTLFSMVLFFAYGALFLFEIIFGLIKSKQDFFFQYISNPKMIFLIAHFVVIFFSAASIVLTYSIGKKIFNNKVGLIASLLFSLSFINIQMSSLIKEDTLALSMLLLGCYFAVNILMSDRGPVKLWFILAGFFMGLAAATKYTFIIGFIFIIAVYFLKNIKRSYIFYPIMSLVFGFLCGNPFIIKESSSFIRGFSSLGPQFYSASLVDNFNQIVFYYWAYFGVIFCLCILFGTVFALIKDTRKAIFILSYPAILIIVFLNFSILGYYILPTVPFFSIIAAYLIYNSLKFIKNNLFRNLCCILLSVAVICPSFVNGLKFKTIITAPDSRALAKAWIENNIEKDTVVLIEGAVVDLIIFSPQLNSNIEALKREKEKVISEGGVGRIYDRRIEGSRENQERVCYNIYKTRAMNTDLLNKIKPDIVIMTGANDVIELLSQKEANERANAQRIVARDYKLMKLFYSYPDLSGFPVLFKGDFLKIKNIKLIKNNKAILAGYNIYIYKRRNLI